jgi:hypothetical protein
LIAARFQISSAASMKRIFAAGLSARRDDRGGHVTHSHAADGKEDGTGICKQR